MDPFPLRLRYGDGREVIDLGYGTDPDDPDPWSIAFVTYNPTTAAHYSPDDILTDPDGLYPPSAPPELLPGDFIRCAAMHFERVNPEMAPYTEEELEMAIFLANLGGIETAVLRLTEIREGECNLLVELRPYH